MNKTFKHLSITVITILSILFSCSQSESIVDTSGNEIVKRYADIENGFFWPYFLYIPPGSLKRKSIYLLVEPNNTGAADDDYNVHLTSAREKMYNKLQSTAIELGTAALIPVFPRTMTDPGWQYYTHALDRDTLLYNTEPTYQRIDLQLINMINDAILYLEFSGYKVHDKFFMKGFSASGSFTNRFCIIHPELVQAASIGSPGGFPIIPLDSTSGHVLNYPVGINDMLTVSGNPFLSQAYQELPQFFYLGGSDNNDGVDYSDGFDPGDKTIIDLLYGEDPVDRWPVIAQEYKIAGCNAEFRMYGEYGHHISSAMYSDTLDFFRQNM
jgi:hypothetical protein